MCHRKSKLCNWVNTCGKLISLIIEILKKNIIGSDYVASDQTKVDVLDDNGSSSYMWVHLSGERERRTIVYDYQENRKGENAVPILEVIKKLLEEVKDAIAPQSIVGKAVGCTLNNWQGLNNYLLDERLRIDNNDSEHSIKPFAVGRKNWMFCATTKGTKASANIYSIIETFKANKINTSCS